MGSNDAMSIANAVLAAHAKATSSAMCSGMDALQRDGLELPYPLRNDTAPRAVYPAGLTHLHDLSLEGQGGEPEFVDTVRESDAMDRYYRRKYGDDL